jgi:hypothetical protein
MIQYICQKIFFPIYIFLIKRDTEINAKIEEVINVHEVLIRQYELIKQKQSTLTANKRREVETQIMYFIEKGHIVFNQ